MPFRLSSNGKYSKLTRHLTKNLQNDPRRILAKYGEKGLRALSAATPVETGLTSMSWHYGIEKTRNGYSLYWYNSVMAGPTPLVILLQYGHGTSTGGYIQGRDFINPALKPIFEAITNDLIKEASK